MENYEYILETEHVSKNFGNLVVLKDINLKVKKGEVNISAFSEPA